MQIGEAFGLFKQLERASRDASLPQSVRSDATLAWNSLGEALLGEGLTQEQLQADTLTEEEDEQTQLLDATPTPPPVEEGARRKLRIEKTPDGGYAATPRTPEATATALTVQSILDAATKHELGPVSAELLALAVRVGELERR